MNTIPVFRNGTIITYSIKQSDSSWSYEDVLIASSFFATCIINSIPEQLSYCLSFIYIMNKKHPDMLFEKTHMTMIKDILKSVNKDL